MKKILLSSLFKTIIVTLLFALSYIFYNLEIVRSNVEDIAFDAIDKFVIAKNKLSPFVKTKSKFLFIPPSMLLQVRLLAL